MTSYVISEKKKKDRRLKERRRYFEKKKNPEYVLMRQKQREEEYQRNKKPVTYYIDKVKDTFTNELLRKNYEDLSRNGYFLISGKLSRNIISQLVKQARSRLKNYSSIFQTKEQAESEADFETKRGQCEVDDTGNFVVWLRSLIVENLGPKYSPVDLLFLRSLRGCEDQAIHCDHDPKRAKEYADNFPLSAILAIQEGSKLVIHHEDLNYVKKNRFVTMSSRREVEIPLGSVLIFHGFLPHGGAAYTSDNYRVHFNIVTNDFKSKENATYLVDVLNDLSLK
ncbi:hypothetical protein ROZALSC1DRAFT_25481 [Rozella allomycis CSF55]|uniref:Phytanoyl-CoA dioxygenase n=1 Tax=Rozella allomycis (strain CSF55) TaxID=988480 RepID=A0A4P9YAH6_ROZAC|nr:hypothetical protein ROZALSC1DRAFT_25481 [Rozella allomycis CSF55]